MKYLIHMKWGIYGFIGQKFVDAQGEETRQVEADNEHHAREIFNKQMEGEYPDYEIISIEVAPPPDREWLEILGLDE